MCLTRLEWYQHPSHLNRKNEKLFRPPFHLALCSASRAILNGKIIQFIRFAFCVFDAPFFQLHTSFLNFCNFTWCCQHLYLINCHWSAFAGSLLQFSSSFRSASYRTLLCFCDIFNGKGMKGNKNGKCIRRRMNCRAPILERRVRNQSSKVSISWSRVKHSFYK